MIPSLPFDDASPRGPRILAEGAVWLPRALDAGSQREVVTTSLAILDGPAGGYVPTVRGGGKMHVRMVCLGRHWNPMTYRYEATRADFDGAPVAPVPAAWVVMAQRLAGEAGFTFQPDVCLINHYGADGRMGLHQDKDESLSSIAAGAPVVSISLGDTARFLFGGLRRRDPIETILLESGDAFVFGGAARLRYHGVAKIFRHAAPSELALSGRISLTFRQY